MRTRSVISLISAIGVIATSGVWIYRQRYQFLSEPYSAVGNPPPETIFLDGNVVPGGMVSVGFSPTSGSSPIPGSSNSKSEVAPFAWSNGAIMNGLATFHDPGEKVDSEQSATVKRLLEGKDFVALEALAKKLRTSKGRLASGKWCLYAFYDATGKPLDVTADGWSKHDALLTSWCKDRPKSVTALVAHASFLISYAWNARGSGYANTVSSEGWALFNQRLVSATELLAKARQLPEKDPHLWHVAQKAAMGLGATRASYEKLFSEAIAFEPTYFHYYEAKAYFLLPRWHGKSGEWERFAEESAQNSPLGLELYARIVSSLTRMHTNIFAESTASWEKTKQGFELIRERFPDSTRIVSDYVRLCKMASDPVTANTLLKALDFKLDATLWPDVNTLTSVYAWASQPNGVTRSSPVFFGSPISKPAAKTFAGKALSPELEAMYKQLEMERQFLDLNNTKAVVRFNALAAKYQASLSAARKKVSK